MRHIMWEGVRVPPKVASRYNGDFVWFKVSYYDPDSLGGHPNSDGEIALLFDAKKTFPIEIGQKARFVIEQMQWSPEDESTE